ncbi:MAG: hypothetical protein LBS89_06110 [Zoogloeaceae bacterium]|jgi:hypothetical protein|nr:hypothetical protein [Zoogloeaceae bacterium]
MSVLSSLKRRISVARALVGKRCSRTARPCPHADASHADLSAAAVLPPAPSPVPTERAPLRTPLPDVIERVEVIEVDNAEFFVGDLFRRRFNTATFPGFPHHFVALARYADGSLIPLGYCHITSWQGNGLGGGLVIDERRYRRLPPSIRKIIREQGGLADMLLRESTSRMPEDTVAIWAYVGDRQAEKADLKVGFRHTRDPHIMAIWRQPLTDAEKENWLRQVIALGPF